MAFPQQANCVAFWNCNGNSLDATGNGNNGTDTSMSYGTSGGIKYGIFGGSSKISVASSSSLSFGTGSNSVSYWINITNASGTIWPGRNVSSGLQLYMISGNASGDGAGLAAACSAGSVNDGTWHHIVDVVDQPNSLIRTYKDGVAGTTYAITGVTSTEAVTKGWGYDPYGQGTGAFTGNIGLMGWWNVVLSPTNVTALYNSGSGLSFPSANGNFLTFM